ncbi:MAG TPA: hypothetical protein VHD83_07810 [Puia sp.]|nr:hypothetical protein [Puia sp.]
MRPIQHLISHAFSGIVLLTIMGAPTPGNAQSKAPETAPQVDEVHASLLAGKKKAMIAYAGKERSFTMDVNAKTVKNSDLPGFITVDGQIVQATLVPHKPAVDARTMTTAQEKETLTKYMNYELGYYKKKLKQNYSQLQTEWVTIKDRLFLVWYFDMPKDYKLVSRQLYFSTLFSTQVLDLNAPVFKTEQFSHARATLNRLANTLKTYDRNLDLEALKKQLN